MRKALQKGGLSWVWKDKQVLAEKGILICEQTERWGGGEMAGVEEVGDSGG